MFSVCSSSARENIERNALKRWESQRTPKCPSKNTDHSIAFNTKLTRIRDPRHVFSFVIVFATNIIIAAVSDFYGTERNIRGVDSSFQNEEGKWEWGREKNNLVKIWGLTFEAWRWLWWCWCSGQLWSSRAGWIHMTPAAPARVGRSLSSHAAWLALTVKWWHIQFHFVVSW